MHGYAYMVGTGRAKNSYRFKEIGRTGVNGHAGSVNERESWQPSFKTGRDITLNNPETKGNPLVRTFF